MYLQNKMKTFKWVTKQNDAYLIITAVEFYWEKKITSTKTFTS